MNKETACPAVGVSRLTLPFTAPYETGPALATLAAHAIPGAERTDREALTHTRLFAAHSGPVAVTIRFGADQIEANAATDQRELDALVPTLRRWLDLDMVPDAVYGPLLRDPIIGPLARARPGLRVLGYPDGFEAAVTTVLGQQVSVAACRTFSGRLVAAFGTPGPSGLTIFPSPSVLAAIDPAELQQAIGLTGARARTVSALAGACTTGLRIASDADQADVRARLLALPGIGPWSADYLAVRALGDRDAFAPGDLVLRRALGGISAREADAASRAWSPSRAYALFQLWTAAAYAA